ncbi:MAG: diguanylate cyclase, partial [Firmicutes bacterium]|nr:diguanylate cyclase [Bacillota bacterium]
VCGPVVPREPGSPAVFLGEALPYEAAPASAEPAAQPDVYALGIETSLPGVAAYATREELFSALAERKPRAVAVSAAYPGALELVRELRSISRLADVPIGVVGAPDGAFFAAGADECFEVLDGQALARLFARGERLVALWQEAATDGLTGLYLRRFLAAHLDDGFGLFREHGVPLSVVFLDLDHFKRINDAYGHSAGDEVLRRLGDFLRRNLRERDAAFRYGGEE